MAVTIYLATTLCCIGIIILVKYYWSRRRFYTLASQLPGPKAWPIIGNGLSFFCKPEGEYDKYICMLVTGT